ncbi:hypothetical protein B296_00029366 [Ensete ventricosum]|uniref:Transcription factor MYC/MYB N-terminal domain-containing protein n=1 Tax=Ensete ventricosum TaxID=4639 RepID=A0A426XXA1_ENSVE|nr:hypothetical protein B296_00029366 [Ensete ventricosum]
MSGKSNLHYGARVLCVLLVHLHQATRVKKLLPLLSLPSYIWSVNWLERLFRCFFVSVLEWSEGSYNGEIKTRKTTQSTEPDTDQMGLQRSKELRDLYESLLSGDSNRQIRRPSTSLSPEDLTEAEWYYLLCMSFTFSTGQGYGQHSLPTSLRLPLPL